VIALTRELWKQSRVPTALSTTVSRRAYVAAVLSASQKPDVTELSVFAPQLKQSNQRGQLAQMQESWGNVRERGGRVRIVTGTSQSSLTAAAELVALDLEVRIPRVIESEELSYHIFNGSAPTTIVNYREGTKSHPLRLAGTSPSRVFRTDFNEIWKSSAPYESVMAEKILDGNPSNRDMHRRINDQKLIYKWNEVAERKVLTHVAFRRFAPVIFVVGLPGAGKSVIRRHLDELLRAKSFQIEQLSDYVFAFRDFVHGAILLDETRGQGFSPEVGGAFQVDDEIHLRPALKALAERVWSVRQATKITLVEFARADTMKALREFGDDILRHAQVIHIRADESVREERLHRRSTPPTIEIDNLNLNISVSDDHRLPSTAAASLYGGEDLSLLLSERALAGRVHQIDTTKFSADSQEIFQALEDFIDRIVRSVTAATP
jgi:dephospho-CoA kinase